MRCFTIKWLNNKFQPHVKAISITYTKKMVHSDYLKQLVSFHNKGLKVPSIAILAEGHVIIVSLKHVHIFISCPLFHSLAFLVFEGASCCRMVQVLCLYLAPLYTSTRVNEVYIDSLTDDIDGSVLLNFDC